jgi:POT family proton-dependent oligopeptide transporter
MIEEGAGRRSAGSTQDTRFLGHPRGLSTLFFTEMWERFGYYGMRALLILFMTAPAASGGLGFDVAKAGSIYGLYTGMVYLVSLPGGWVADRFLGQRRAVLYGGMVISLGYLMLAAPDVRVFYAGLCVVVIGTGLLKPNISTIVGQIYAPGDPRRDAGFSIFYMGINLGAFLAPLICGYAGQRINWHLGFALSGIGMAFGVIQFWAGRRHLGDAGLHPVPAENEVQAARQRRNLRALIWSLVLLPLVLAGVEASGVYEVSALALVNLAGIMLFAIVAAIFGWMLLGKGWTAEERRRLYVILVLFLAASLFWSLFEQAGSSLNLFAQRSTDNRIFGWEFPASWFQSMNAFFIVALAPVISWIWLRLGERQPSSPAKFALGLLCAGLGYAVLIPGALMAEGGARVSMFFLIGTYFFHTVGELCLSPVGLSAMTKLAPERVAGFMMGVWFVSISVGNYLGGRLASLYGELPIPTLFTITGAFGIAVAVLVALIARPVERMMGDVR